MGNIISENLADYSNYLGKMNGQSGTLSRNKPLNIKESNDLVISDQDFYNTMDWYKRFGEAANSDKGGYIEGAVKEYNNILGQIDKYDNNTKKRLKDNLDQVYKNVAGLYASSAAIDINLAHMKWGITYSSKPVNSASTDTDLVDYDTSKQINKDIFDMFYKAKDYYDKNKGFEGMTNEYVTGTSSTFTYSDVLKMKDYIKAIQTGQNDQSGLSDFAQKIFSKSLINEK